MISFKEYLAESQQMLTWDDIHHVEQWAEKFFHQIGVDLEFGKHFFDRVNDFRNKPRITLGELQSLFGKIYQKYAGKLKFMKPGMEALFKDMATDINVPVIFKWNPVKKMVEMISKTIMRKKNFKNDFSASREAVLPVR